MAELTASAQPPMGNIAVTGSAGPASELSLTVHVKPLDAKDMFYMSESDWSRFGGYLQELSDASAPVHDRYILFAGIAAGGALAFLGWIAVIATVPDPSLLVWAVGIVIAAMTVAGAAIAWSNHDTEQFLNKKFRKDSTLLWEDMNRTHPFGDHPASSR